MKNVQIIDGAVNATFSVFQATEEEFALIFPTQGQDIEVVEDVVERMGEAAADQLLTPLWSRPILRREAMGIHGLLYYDSQDRRDHLPPTKREVDWDERAINQAQRELFALKRRR